LISKTKTTLLAPRMPLEQYRQRRKWDLGFSVFLNPEEALLHWFWELTK
jgi:hypothetical protein